MAILAHNTPFTTPLSCRASYILTASLHRFQIPRLCGLNHHIHLLAVWQQIPKLLPFQLHTLSTIPTNPLRNEWQILRLVDIRYRHYSSFGHVARTSLEMVVRGWRPCISGSVVDSSEGEDGPAMSISKEVQESFSFLVPYSQRCAGTPCRSLSCVIENRALRGPSLKNS